MTQGLVLCPLCCDKIDWANATADSQIESDPILKLHLTTLKADTTHGFA